MKVVQSNDPNIITGSEILFVEGQLDLLVVDQIAPIPVKPLGSASGIRAAAGALRESHPGYFFLIDRDHYSAEEVQDSRRKFEANESNLLIWPKRMIENYFIDPEFLEQADYCVCPNRLRDEILKQARLRLYLDIANMVIVSVREDLKKRWIELFRQPEEFGSLEMVICKLKRRGEFADFRGKASRLTAENELESRAREIYDRMTGGAAELQWGLGDWADLSSGKEIMNAVIGGNIFDLPGNLEHARKVEAIVRDLLRKNWANDFVELKELLNNRINGTSSNE